MIKLVDDEESEGEKSSRDERGARGTRNMPLWTSLITELSVPSVSALALSVDQLSVVQARLDNVAVLPRIVVSTDAMISVVSVPVLLGRDGLSPTRETVTESAVPWRWTDALDLLFADGDGSVVVAHVRRARSSEECLSLATSVVFVANRALPHIIADAFAILHGSMNSQHLALVLLVLWIRSLQLPSIALLESAVHDTQSEVRIVSA